LNEFTNSGKFAILKEKIALTIKAIVVDKVRKERIGGAIDTKSIQKTLSELNVYFQ
jgi:hypothetical protein